MYESYFGLNEPPFNLTPDPRFVYLSKSHQDALDSMLYGVERRVGFMQITGEIGAGKTTLSRLFLRQLGEKIHTALVFNPKLSEVEILREIVEDFGLTPKTKTRKDCFDCLNKFLLEENTKGFNAVVIIDEAQLLSPKALEQIRLLSNLETTTQKLLQIVLMGQPELRDLLSRSDLKQLFQRISVRCHLSALSHEETKKYLEFRLSVAGSVESVFSDDAVRKIYELSGGIPRLINSIADRSLLAAFTKSIRTVDSSLVECADADLGGVAV